MNFLIYYGIGFTFVTGVILFVDMFTTYFDDLGIELWGKLEWIGTIIDILLLSFVWPMLLIINIVYIIKNKKS